ncbi:hypothetical protein Lalb_Chr11g0067401 [Lupinus albus]|uniref:Uncharacterized protein n=1 Tax=Lupinus albus TaxID=3870 RepID=A0A6A4PS00_LUPAL|nr:hypothetical protein Lalb_Chr11g0067401 [Lupinus albus]
MVSREKVSLGLSDWGFGVSDFFILSRKDSRSGLSLSGKPFFARRRSSQLFGTVDFFFCISWYKKSRVLMPSMKKVAEKLRVCE